MSKSEVARQYREQYPDFPSHKLARIMYAENNLLFKDKEDARYRLRYIEGKTGSPKRKFVINSSTYMKDARPLNPYKLPESDEANYTPFIIKGYKKLGILSDIHLPYHSLTALTAAIAYLKKKRLMQSF
jgi:hypothetical protein